jgi:L-ribulose-5-phosphate 3-epimerase
MASERGDSNGDRLTRRAALRSSIVAAGGAAALGGAAGNADEGPRQADPNRGPIKRYDFKKSINMWAFPYPEKMDLRACLRLAKDVGFEAVELNYDLDHDLSPHADEARLRGIRELAREVGIGISGVCSFLYWPYSLTDSDPARRARGLELAESMIRAAHALGTSNLLTIAGSVYIPWIKDREPVSFEDCDRRARAAIGKLLPLAEELDVSLNIENIFFNGYLSSPPEMAAFVDSFHHGRIGVHFDTGNIMPFQFPEHWIPVLGRRIRNVHLKEFNKKGTDYTLESFDRPPFFGTTDWPAVMAALDAVGYKGYVTWEYFHPTAHFPEAAIAWTSDAMDRILGRKA